MSESSGSSLQTPAPDPQRLGLLLREAGWQVVGERRGAYIRMAPPNWIGSSVLVPLDRNAPEFSDTMKEAVADIQRLAIQTSSTVNVSALLAAEPTDGFHFRAESSAPSGLIAWNHGERLIKNSRLMLTAGAKTYMDHLAYYGNRFWQFASRYLDTVLMGQTAPGSYVVSAFVPSSGVIPLTSHAAFESENVRTLFKTDIDMASTRAVGVSTWIAAAATSEAVNHYRSSGSLSGFEALISRGVSHEMTVALRGLVEGTDGAELSVEWDETIPLPGDVPESRIELRPADSDILTKASNDLLARASEPTRVIITGWVHLLSRKEVGVPGVIGVENLSRGKPHKVRVHLNDDDYHRALRAHDEDLAVVVEGVIEREGNIHWMYEGRLVNVLAPIEEIREALSKRPTKVSKDQGVLDFEA